MSREDFLRAREGGWPYFGLYLACRKSWPHIYWYQQKLVKFLSQSRPPKELRVLEIGSWAGASAYSWCEATKRYFAGRGRVTCVDIWAPGPAAADDPPIHEVFHHNMRASGFADTLESIQADSDAAFRELKGRQFEVVYVDGDHSYAQVGRDIGNALKVIAPGGVLCGDDLDVQAGNLAPDVLRRDSETPGGWAIDAESRSGYHPGVTRAVAELIGPVSAWGGFWAMRRTENGWQTIELDKVEATIPRPLMEYDDQGNRVLDV